MREAEGDYVQKTLHLMDDRICEWEGLPVLHSWTAVFSDHCINLLLHFLCTGQYKRYLKPIILKQVKDYLAFKHNVFRIGKLGSTLYVWVFNQHTEAISDSGASGFCSCQK